MSDEDGLFIVPNRVTISTAGIVPKIYEFAKLENRPHLAISLSSDTGLRFEVRDDGVGFDRLHVVDGNGLANLRDRLSAVGGDLTIESRPGAGTRVVGSVPVASGGA